MSESDPLSESENSPSLDSLLEPEESSLSEAECRRLRRRLPFDFRDGPSGPSRDAFFLFFFFFDFLVPSESPDGLSSGSVGGGPGGSSLRRDEKARGVRYESVLQRQRPDVHAGTPKRWRDETDVGPAQQLQKEPEQKAYHCPLHCHAECRADPLEKRL